MDNLVTAFDQELNELNNEILKMGGLVQTAIFRSIEALKNRSRDIARGVIKQDVEIDRLELDIDDKCINMIAIRQPKAGDLRLITTGMRIATDLERIGDLAEDIAERGIELAERPLLKPLVDIPKMGELTEKALDIALTAFVKRDSKNAQTIWEIEKEVDSLRDRVQNELINIMRNDGETVSRAIPLLLIARHLERISDHATNIAEDVIYMVEAKVVKHSGGSKN
jgi:phosphate transport system protein